MNIYNFELFKTSASRGTYETITCKFWDLPADGTGEAVNGQKPSLAHNSKIRKRTQQYNGHYY